jgi:hypothetical protein
MQLSPADPTTPTKSIGNPQRNIGIFVLSILNLPDKTLPGRFVIAHTEETTTGQMLKDWSEVTGKRSVYVKTNLEDFSEVWPMWGEEMGIMMKMWDELKDQSWSGEPEILNKDDLGISAEKLGGFKEALAEMNWDALL